MTILTCCTSKHLVSIFYKVEFWGPSHSHNRSHSTVGWHHSTPEGWVRVGRCVRWRLNETSREISCIYSKLSRHNRSGASECTYAFLMMHKLEHGVWTLQTHYTSSRPRGNSLAYRHREIHQKKVWLSTLEWKFAIHGQKNMHYSPGTVRCISTGARWTMDGQVFGGYECWTPWYRECRSTEHNL